MVSFSFRASGAELIIGGRRGRGRRMDGWREAAQLLILVGLILLLLGPAWAQQQSSGKKWFSTCLHFSPPSSSLTSLSSLSSSSIINISIMLSEVRISAKCGLYVWHWHTCEQNPALQKKKLREIELETLMLLRNTNIHNLPAGSVILAGSHWGGEEIVNCLNTSLQSPRANHSSPSTELLAKSSKAHHFFSRPENGIRVHPQNSVLGVKF